MTVTMQYLFQGWNFTRKCDGTAPCPTEAAYKHPIKL
jgi:hypothetical protein